MFFESIFASSVFSDLISPQLFDFKFMKTEHIPDNVVLYRTEKRKFYCTIPPNPDASSGFKIDNSIDYSNYFQLKKCLYLNSGWWTYELCNDFIKQVHLENNIETDGYLLGKHSSGYDIEERNGQHVIIKTYNKGSQCEVNGKPRTVKMEYGCLLDQDKVKLMNLFEESTCIYKGSVHVPELCLVEGFQKKANTNDIICYYKEEKKNKQPPKSITLDEDEEEEEMEANEEVKDGKLDFGKLSDILNKMITEPNVKMVMMDQNEMNLEKTLETLKKLLKDDEEEKEKDNK